MNLTCGLIKKENLIKNSLRFFAQFNTPKATEMINNARRLSPLFHQLILITMMRLLATLH